YFLHQSALRHIAGSSTDTPGSPAKKGQVLQQSPAPWSLQQAPNTCEESISTHAVPSIKIPSFPRGTALGLQLRNAQLAMFMPSAHLTPDPKSSCEQMHTIGDQLGDEGRTVSWAMDELTRNHCAQSVRSQPTADSYKYLRIEQ